QHDRAGIDTPYFTEQRKWAQRTGMTARTGANKNQPVDTGFQGLLRVPDVDDVMEHQPTPAVNARHVFIGCTQAGNDYWHPVLLEHIEIRVQTLVALVHD